MALEDLEHQSLCPKCKEQHADILRTAECQLCGETYEVSDHA
jgi:predicted RNA-binding Zn-ribbon protein involved in translation (DUF1610 family)